MNSNDKPSKVPITPKTKIWNLLEAYPGLEPLLMEMSPAFKKLKNPVLRRTVAKVATIQQVAEIAGLNLGEMINKLRQEVGMEETTEYSDNAIPATNETPSWFDQAAIVKTLDAIPLIEKGEHPVNLVLDALNQLEKGKIFQLITPFKPVPIMDKARENGFKVCSLQEEDHINTYFLHPE